MGVAAGDGGGTLATVEGTVGAGAASVGLRKGKKRITLKSAKFCD